MIKVEISEDYVLATGIEKWHSDVQSAFLESVLVINFWIIFWKPLQFLNEFQKFTHRNNLGTCILLKYQQIFISYNQIICIGIPCKRQQKIIFFITAKGYVIDNIKKLGNVSFKKKDKPLNFDCLFF